MPGVDIIELENFKRSLEIGGNSFLIKNFSAEELGNQQPQHLAGIFAAKEAVFKTGYLEMFSPLEIQVLSESSGKPFVADKFGAKIKTLEISISHTEQTVIAIAIFKG